MKTNDQNFDDFMRKHVKDNREEKVPIGFTDNVMQHVDEEHAFTLYQNAFRQHSGLRIFLPVIGILVLWISVFVVAFKAGWLQWIYSTVSDYSMRLFDSKMVLFIVAVLIVYQVITKLMLSYTILANKNFKI